MDILSALQTEASKLQQQLDTINSAIKVLGGGNSTGSGRRKHHGVTSKDGTGATGAVGEGESHEEECLSGTCASVDGCLALNAPINPPT